MEEIIREHQELEMDLRRLVHALRNRAWWIGIAAVICAVVTFLGTWFLVAPRYQSTAMFYVNNNALSPEDASLSISSADISASRGLVKSYIVILKTQETLQDVITRAGVDRTCHQLRQMITAEAVDATEFFRVVVTSPDPQEAYAIADAVAYVLPQRISRIIDGTSAKIVDPPVTAACPSGPGYGVNTAVGFLVGLILAGLWVVLRTLTDITIRTEEDIAQNCPYPVLAAIGDMEAHPGRGGHHGYGRKHPGGKASGAQAALVGGAVCFTAREGYKLLRTKLQFSLVDEDSCRVIGISSPLREEGKSLTAVNLAYSTSLLAKRVLLVECDMRRPSLEDKLPVTQIPGLSDFLSGQIPADCLLQPCGIPEEETAFHVISAGSLPPNPIELLSSRKMQKMIELLRQRYDYIFLDLPPVEEVGDALAATKLSDGILLVVRQNHCNRSALLSAVRQLEFVQAKILGIVFNATAQSSDHPGRPYRKHGRKAPPSRS